MKKPIVVCQPGDRFDKLVLSRDLLAKPLVVFKEPSYFFRFRCHLFHFFEDKHGMEAVFVLSPKICGSVDKLRLVYHRNGPTLDRGLDREDIDELGYCPRIFFNSYQLFYTRIKNELKAIGYDEDNNS